jgi:hypothetical protein
MSVFKYVSQEGALRYLQTWALRITPPDQFNDPFEMRQPVELCAKEFLEQAPSFIRQALKEQLTQIAVDRGFSTESEHARSFFDDLIAYFMREMLPSDEKQFFQTIRDVAPLGMAEQLQDFRPQFDTLLQSALNDATSQLPAFSKIAQSAMHLALPRVMGVLCLSGSSKHPLMWGHYTDSHKGALLEFNESAPCFNRHRNEGDDFGRLHRVWYSDSRPTLLKDSSAGTLVAFALTKALEWAYEQELRLLWPLQLADRTVHADGKSVHLINIPATALRNITVGCKADSKFTAKVIRSVAAADPSLGIKIRVASMDDLSFSLNYRDLF